MAERSPRKLAVILHADVVGSTMLVQQNETLTHDRIQDAFTRFAATINAYGGRAHELRGDALVAEFDRASDAVCSALAFQVENAAFNATLDDDIRPELRIGISMGEVVIADGTVTGAGVVLAQRLEQLAEPGGVCIQGAAYETVLQRLPFDFQSLGEQELKGFEEPVRAYAVTLKPGEVIPSPEPRSATREAKPAWRIIGGAVVAVLILVGVGLAWWQPWVPREEPASVERMAFPLPDKPSIAVLPFDNLGGDPEQEYFADGMTDSIITDLSKISNFFVVARNSTFAYKGKLTDIGMIARDLGVKHVLEGSVQRAADKIRINAQLIDGTSGGHIWAERYDGTIEDLFDLQDEVIGKIVTALSLELVEGPQESDRATKTRSVEAYDAFLRGMHHYRKATPEHYAKAVEYLSNATALDANFGEAYAVLAAIYLRSNKYRFFRELGLESVEAWSKMKENVQLAMKTPSPMAYQVASGVSLELRRHNEAIEQAEKAISGNPNDAEGHAALAFALVMSGMPAKAMASVKTARRLDPHNEFYYAFLQGITEFNQGQFEAAVVSFERALELNPELWSSPTGWGCAPSAPLLSAYAHLGRKKAVQELLSKGEFDCPIETIVGMSWPFKETRDVERLSEGLRLAGLRERD